MLGRRKWRFLLLQLIVQKNTSRFDRFKLETASVRAPMLVESMARDVLPGRLCTEQVSGADSQTAQCQSWYSRRRKEQVECDLWLTPGGATRSCSDRPSRRYDAVVACSRRYVARAPRADVTRWWRHRSRYRTTSSAFARLRCRGNRC